jgi:hypothetical protein
MSRLLAGLMLLSCVAPLTAQGGKLQQVRETVSRPDEPEDDRKKDDDCDDDEDDSFLGEVVGGLFSGGTAAGAAEAGEGGEDFGSGYSVSFPRFPYENDCPGYLYPEGAQPSEEYLKHFGGTVALDYGHDLDNLGRYGLGATVDTTSRLGFRMRLDGFEEKLPCGCTDHISTGNFDLTFRWWQEERVQLHAGIGYRHLDAGADTEGGINFMLGGDVFPVRPVVVSVTIDAGSVGDAGLFRARGTVGVIYRRFEAFTGYDYLDIGGVDLQGVLAGLRVWY